VLQRVMPKLATGL